MHAPRQKQHLSEQSDELVTLFNRCFADKFNTVLVGGADEPVYLPADRRCSRHRILFSHNYFASALHEVAHWCVAGDGRRQQIDYGYWYAPDGRSAEQQHLFERVEVKPQALEWLFSEAAGAPFRVSADNLEQELSASRVFRQNIALQAQAYSQNGVPPRALTFITTLAQHYSVTEPLRVERYRVERLQ